MLYLLIVCLQKVCNLFFFILLFGYKPIRLECELSHSFLKRIKIIKIEKEIKQWVSKEKMTEW